MNIREAPRNAWEPDEPGVPDAPPRDWARVWRALASLLPGASESIDSRSIDSASADLDKNSVDVAGDSLDYAHTQVFRDGMTGLLARRHDAPLLASDLTHWLLPGLRYCGIQAELVPLPLVDTAPATTPSSQHISSSTSESAAHGSNESANLSANLSANEAGIAMLRRLTARGRAVVLFGFRSPFEPSWRPIYAEPDFLKSATKPRASRPVPQSEQNTRPSLTIEDPDPMILRQALLIEGGHCLLESGERLTYAELLGGYSHCLVAHRGTGRGRRLAHCEAAIMQWTLFALACPGRYSGMGVGDRERRSEAARFWRLLAGNGRTFPFNRLRRLATLLESRDGRDVMHLSIDLLLELACVPYLLPSLVEGALRAPTNQVLSDIERRELIYLARAGNRDLRIMASARLRPEREHQDARETLRQLAFDPDPWVRSCSLYRG